MARSLPQCGQRRDVIQLIIEYTIDPMKSRRITIPCPLSEFSVFASDDVDKVELRSDGLDVSDDTESDTGEEEAPTEDEETTVDESTPEVTE